MEDSLYGKEETEVKKLIALAAALVCILAPAGCNDPVDEIVPEAPAADVVSAPDVPSVSKRESIPFSGDQLYAVACLGYGEMSELSYYTESYLDDENLPIHYVSPGEYYLIIPRYEGMEMRLYRNEFDTGEKVLFYEAAGSDPVIVQCNVSDIFPDVTIQLSYQAETVEFSPCISLKDGSVVVGDRGFDLTRGA